MTPKMKIFINVFPNSATGHRDTFRDHFGENRPLRSCRKVAWFTKQKKLGLHGLVPAAILAKWADCAKNSLNVVTPWPVHVCRIWSGSATFCRTYSGKIDFSAQIVNTISAYTYQIYFSRLSILPYCVCDKTLIAWVCWISFYDSRVQYHLSAILHRLSWLYNVRAYV